MSLLVKICGLSTPETLDVALDAGADAVGFNFFPPSPRYVSLAAARDLGARVKGRAEKVAVTVDLDDATLTDIVEAMHPDAVAIAWQRNRGTRVGHPSTVRPSSREGASD